jgi:cytochrome P450
MGRDGSGVDYDPFDPATMADPASAHRTLREACPVHFHPDFGERGFYTLARHDDVADLFDSVERWSADWGQAPIYVKEGGLKSDPPEHTIYRRLVTGAFTARRVSAMEGSITDLANRLIDRFVDRGEADLIADYAVPLPTTIIAEMLGVSTDHLDSFKQWSDEFMAGQNASDPEVQGRARAKMDAYFAAVLAERRERLASASADATIVGDVLPDDVLTSLLLARHEGEPFTDEQLVPLLLLLLVGGNETTTSLIGNLVWRLQQLGLWERVGADESLWDVAIEESLRYDPPVMGLFRTAKGEQTVRGVTIPHEAKVEGLYASANRDPEVWDDPDTFRLDRDLAALRKNHMSFGRGIWFCPGAQLSRLETRISIRLLHERLPHLRLAGGAERVESFMMWGLSSLPMAWDV